MVGVTSAFMQNSGCSTLAQLTGGGAMAMATPSPMATLLLSGMEVGFYLLDTLLFLLTLLV